MATGTTGAECKRGVSAPKPGKGSVARPRPRLSTLKYGNSRAAKKDLKTTGRVATAFEVSPLSSTRLVARLNYCSPAAAYLSGPLLVAF